MRKYLYLFWGLVLAGIIILTAAYPECRQAANLQYPTNLDYSVYDQNGACVFVRGGGLDAHMSAMGRPADQSRL